MTQEKDILLTPFMKVEEAGEEASGHGLCTKVGLIWSQLETDPVWMGCLAATNGSDQFGIQ